MCKLKRNNIQPYFHVCVSDMGYKRQKRGFRLKTASAKHKSWKSLCQGAQINNIFILAVGFSGVSEAACVWIPRKPLWKCGCTCFDLFPLGRFAFGRSFSGRGVHRAADGHRVVFHFLQKARENQHRCWKELESLEMGFKSIKAV